MAATIEITAKSRKASKLAMKAAKPELLKKKTDWRKSKLFRSIWKRRLTVMKIALFAVLAIALYIVLGQNVAVANNVALVITLLGKFGVLTYKGVVATCTFIGLAKNYG